MAPPLDALRDHGPTVLWTSWLLILLWIPGDSMPSIRAGWLPPGTDLLVHGVLFFVEGLVLERSFRRLSWEKPLAAALGCGGLLAAATELGQLVVSGRRFEGVDLAADLVGLGAASLMILRPMGGGTNKG